MTEAGPLVQLQISVSRVPWRIAPAWSVLAGACAAGTPLNDSALWLRVVAAVVLGDLAWGVLRRYVRGRDAHQQEIGADPEAGLSALLPYAQPQAPVSALVRELALGEANWHGALAGLLLALAGGVLLGLPALGLSVAAVLVTVVAWSLARRGDTPAAGYALLDVLLPFTLGLFAAGGPVARAATGGFAWQPLAVAAGFTIFQWTVLRAAAQRGAAARLALGAGVVLAVLVGLGMPWAAAACAVLLAPVLYDGGRSAGAFAWMGIWSLLAWFVAALALR